MASSTPKTPSSGTSLASLHRPAPSSRQGSVATIPYDRPVALMTSGAPLLNPRSCVTCRRRRVRCDKTMPCSNCRRAQSDCMYPAPGRAPRQTQAQMRPPPQSGNGQSEREMDLMERLRKLEGLVYEMNGQGNISENNIEASDGESSKTHDTNRTGHDILQATAEKIKRDSENTEFSKVDKQLGRLVLHDGDSTARYVNSGFMVKLNDEVSVHLLRNFTATTDPDSLRSFATKWSS